MADWELQVQLPSGAIQAGFYRGNGSKRPPAVFNTGQVVLGWCRAFSEPRDERELDAAVRAGNWLADGQDSDGAWRQHAPETETVVHAYDVRTAWSLLELYQLVDEQRFLDAARRNLEWTLAQQHDNGWFEHNAFFVSADKWNVPLTHTIAYVMEGLMGAWSCLRDDRYLEAALRTATRLREIFEQRGVLPGEFDSTWSANATYSCLTGHAQVAGVWLRLRRERRAPPRDDALGPPVFHVGPASGGAWTRCGPGRHPAGTQLAGSPWKVQREAQRRACGSSGGRRPRRHAAAADLAVHRSDRGLCAAAPGIRREAHTVTDGALDGTVPPHARGHSQRAPHALRGRLGSGRRCVGCGPRARQDALRRRIPVRSSARS